VSRSDRKFVFVRIAPNRTTVSGQAKLLTRVDGWTRMWLSNEQPPPYQIKITVWEGRKNISA